MSSSALNPKTATLIGLLLVAVWQDLKTKKISNHFILIAFAIALSLRFASDGLSGLAVCSASIAVAFISSLPLYLMKVFAGGDYKLFIALSPLLDWQETLIMLGAALVWGALLGLLMVLFRGNLKNFFRQLLLMLTFRQKIDHAQTTQIPFSVALFFGYLSALTIQFGGLL